MATTQKWDLTENQRLIQEALDELDVLAAAVLLPDLTPRMSQAISRMMDGCISTIEGEIPILDKGEMVIHYVNKGREIPAAKRIA